MALTDKLSAIGDAIREKTGKEELLTLEQMPEEIASITTGGGEVEPIVLTGSQDYGCAGQLAAAYIEKYGNTITTEGITSAQYMFNRTTLTKIPFDINLRTNSATSCSYLFQNAEYLTELPKVTGRIGNINYMFSNCHRLREIPDNYFDSIDWGTGSTSYNTSSMFTSCYSLRNLPVDAFHNTGAKGSYSGSYYYSGFTHCHVLDELIDLPVPYTGTTWTSNGFNNAFSQCNRLKNITFETPNGQPVVVTWKGQTIDLTIFVGYVQVSSIFSPRITSYNTGITADKEVTDDASYQALKNDADWFTDNTAYSRYNHDSAVATINSLPDTSAYLATQTSGTNTIKFRGAAGELTDGGAISNLTEEEIAVATAKGWTVTLS